MKRNSKSEGMIIILGLEPHSGSGFLKSHNVDSDKSINIFKKIKVSNKKGMSSFFNCI